MDREALIDQLAAKLKEWNAEIERLESKADMVEAQAKEEYEERIRKLRAKYQASKEKLEDLEQSSGDAWQELQSGVESAFDDMKSAIQDARRKFE